LNSILSPPPLAVGSKVGVAALSGVVDRAALAVGIERIRELGLVPIRAANLELADGIFAGSDAERIEGFHRLLAREEVAAMLFARGGHGLLRVLPELDWQLIAARPRWFVGYSDLTPLLNGIVDRLHWAAVHGPMVAVEPAQGWQGAELESFRALLFGETPEAVPLAGTRGDWQQVAAPLAGGCLAMLTATLGTPWATPLAGKVLFVEDVGEPYYRLDRMFRQLRLAGALDAIDGVILGAFTAAEGTTHQTQELIEIVQSSVPGPVPIAWGCPSGHCRPNLALPLGATVTVDAAALRLRFAVPAASAPGIG